MTDLDKAIAATLGVEGKWSDHDADPGGKTMYGITEATFERAKRLIDSKSIRWLTVKEARQIYREMYWKQCGAHLLKSGVNALVFDICVNSGPRRAGLILQRSINSLGGSVTVDGKVGRRTAEGAEKLDAFILINEISARRHVFWSRLKIWTTFRFGWTRRGYVVHTHAVLMAARLNK